MKATNLQKKIESKLTTKKGEVAVRYSQVINFLTYPSKYHPYEWRGTGRYIRLAGHSGLKEALDLLGIDYTTGNDAPRGGQQGYYVELTKKGLQQTKEWRIGRLLEIKLKAEEAALKEAAAKVEYEVKVQKIRNAIAYDPRLSDYINRKRSKGESDRTIAWKLTSETRNPNLNGYSVKEIISAITN